MLKTLYNKVFDGMGNVKLCGREACMDLILACEKEQKGVDFGNSRTGMMNIENIKEFMKQVE